MSESNTADDAGTDTEQSQPATMRLAEGPDEPLSPTPADTATIDAGRLEHLDTTDRERYLRKRKKNCPDLEEVSSRVRDNVFMEMLVRGRTVIQAPTGSNKTGSVVETKWRDHPKITGDQPVVNVSGTVAQREEATERAKTNGLKVCQIEGSHDLCGMAGGKYDGYEIDGEPLSEWFENRLRGRGVESFGYVHDWAVSRLKEQGIEPPCCPGEKDCPSTTRWPEDGFVDDNGEPRYDLINVTDPFAFVPSLRDQTNIIHDEQPDYAENLGLDSPTPTALTARARKAINLLLERSDNGPNTWEALLQAGRESAREYAEELDEYDDHGARKWLADLLHNKRLSAVCEFYEDPGLDWYMEVQGSHALAPAIIRATWKALHGEPRNVVDPDARGGGIFDENGLASATIRHESAHLNGSTDGTPNQSLVTVVIDDQNTIRSIRNAPDFSTARSVIGLDAFPSMPLWQQNVHSEMSVKRTLTAKESQLFRRFEQGQTVVELGTADRPAGKDGKFYNEDHLDALVEEIHKEYGESFRTAGTPKELEDIVESVMADHGVEDTDLMTYGEQNSRNDFARELVGLVYSCIDAGDDYVLNLLSERGLDAVPERSDTPCDHCDGHGCHECGRSGYKRAHGRGFVGPSADKAMEILESVRANQVAQMVGRYGRDLDVEAGERNITYVATAVLSKHPSTRHLVDYQTEGVIHTETALERQLVEYVTDHGRSTTREIADAVNCSKKYVISVLDDVKAISRRCGTGEHGADEWAIPYDDYGSLNDVDLCNGIVTSDVYNSSTWQVTIERIGRLDLAASAADVEDTPSSDESSGSDPPP